MFKNYGKAILKKGENLNSTENGKKKPFFRQKKKKTGKNMVLARIVIAGIMLLLHTYPVSSRGETDSITEGAIYKPDTSRINGIRETCGKSKKDFYSCYIAFIQKDGATKEAIAFIKLLGEPGYMRDYKKAGAVGIAFVIFPFRANENNGCFLVNGNPPLINVDDMAEITSKMLQNDEEYLKLKKKYPDIALWMGDRTGTDFIRTVQLKKGGVRFSIPYRLTEGCRACEDVGEARIGLDFDARGNITGRTVLKVRAVNEKETGRR